MGKQQVLEYIETNSLKPVPVRQVADALGYSRQYVHAVILRAGMKSLRPGRKVHTCSVCRRPVKPRSHRPSRLHATCAAGLRKVMMNCDYCGQPHEKFRSAASRANKSFCSNEHRIAALREGFYRVGPRPKVPSR